jgi:hypothetical protein
VSTYSTSSGAGSKYIGADSAVPPYKRDGQRAAWTWKCQKGARGDDGSLLAPTICSILQQRVDLADTYVRIIGPYIYSVRRTSWRLLPRVVSTPEIHCSNASKKKANE